MRRKLHNYLGRIMPFILDATTGACSNVNTDNYTELFMQYLNMAPAPASLGSEFPCRQTRAEINRGTMPRVGPGKPGRITGRGPAGARKPSSTP